MRHLARLLQRFVADQQGQALIMMTVMLPALVGFSLLAIDMARVNNLHNDLQRAADAFALAAAAELDGTAGAIGRADKAIVTLLENQSRFADGGVHTLALADLTVTYLDEIPPSDSIALSAAGIGGNGVDYSTTEDSDARFAEVTVNPTGFTSIFPASFLGGSDTMNVGAQAVAGFGSAVCNYTPLFICNPYGSLEAMQAALTGTSRPMMLLKQQTGGVNAQFGPGNYGYLDNPDGSRQNKDIAEMLAVINPRACYADDGVKTKPGNIPVLHEAINVRFDMYGNGANPSVAGYGLNPSVNPPAPNVRKGKVHTQNGANCGYADPNPSQSANYKPLPRDNCFTTSSCASAGTGDSSIPNRLGDGAWDFNAYWDTNWPSGAGSNASHKSEVLSEGQCGASPSRYCVYKYEAAHIAEQTAPRCHTTTQGPERRLLYVAVIDCVENAVSGGGNTYPVQVFASVFLTEPAAGPPDADIYGELIDISGEYGLGTLEQFRRDEAQLYR